MNMPKSKYKFTAIEETITDEHDEIIGTIRVKPVSRRLWKPKDVRADLPRTPKSSIEPVRVLWKPKGQRKFFTVDLETFTDWITNPATGASKTAS